MHWLTALLSDALTDCPISFSVQVPNQSEGALTELPETVLAWVLNAKAGQLEIKMWMYLRAHVLSDCKCMANGQLKSEDQEGVRGIADG